MTCGQQKTPQTDHNNKTSPLTPHTRRVDEIGCLHSSQFCISTHIQCCNYVLVQVPRVIYHVWGHGKITWSILQPTKRKVNLKDINTDTPGQTTVENRRFGTPRKEMNTWRKPQRRLVRSRTYRQPYLSLGHNMVRRDKLQLFQRGAVYVLGLYSFRYSMLRDYLCTFHASEY